VFERYRKAKAAEDLNLIPIMNLMMTLIPFLLLGAAFYHIGVIPTSLPTHTPEGGAENEKSELVTLNLSFEKAKLELTVSGSSLSEEEALALGGTFPRAAAGFDLKAIQGKVMLIKGKYPKSDTMIVLPADEVEYQDLVDVLDVTRERIVQVEGKDAVHEPLFPVTVFSRLIPAEAEASKDPEAATGQEATP